jgi:hypothetical protein
MSWTRDFDLYVMIPAAIVLAVLNIPYVSGLTGIVLKEWVDSAILLAFSVISISILQDRKIRRQLIDRIDISELGVIQKSYPSNLAAEIEKAKSVRLIGISMLSHVKDYLSLFESKLERGGQLDVLVSDPGGEFVSIATTRDQTTDVEYQRGRISETLEILDGLNSRFKGRARARRTDAPLDGEYIILFDDAGVSKIFYRHYGYKTRYDSSVYLHIDSRIPDCFNYFKQHVDHLWDYAS